MKIRILVGLALVVGLAAVAFGHHGTAISYDQNKQVEIRGTVTEFAWKNPHSALYLDVKGPDGKVTNYAIELNSPGVLTRQGWNRNFFKVGDEVVISVHPSLANAPVGECLNPCKVSINGKEAK